MLKKIGSQARYDIENMLEMKVNLKLWVKVKKDWRDSDFLMKNFGYNKKESAMSDLLKLTGIVLLAAPAGEYDKRVVILTKERGKITAFAKGARRQNSPLLAAASPFAFGEFSLLRGPGTPTGWCRRRSSSISGRSPRITSPPCYGFYFLELADYYSREGEGEPELLKLLYAALRAMIRKQQPKKLVRYVYELRVLVLNGEYPEAFHCACCGTTEHLNRFSLGRNGFLCETCAPGEGRRVETSTVYAMQYIISAPLNRLFAFTVSEEVLEEFQWMHGSVPEEVGGPHFHSLEMLI